MRSRLRGAARAETRVESSVSAIYVLNV